MTRAKHLAWAKQRALEYVDQGDVKNAIASMLSDLNKHKETQGSTEAGFAICLFVNTPEQARKWVEGFL